MSAGARGRGRGRRRGWGGLPVVGAALAGLMAGCSSPKPVVEPPPPVVSEEPSPSPSPTPTVPGPVKPERPADMERTDEVGAAAAAVYFLELYPYVKGTGEVEEWTALSFPTDCEFCTNLARSAAENRAAKQTYVGGAVDAQVQKVYSLDTLYGAYPLDVSVEQSDLSIVGADGAVISAEPATSLTLRVVVLHDGADWRLVDVGEAGTS